MSGWHLLRPWKLAAGVNATLNEMFGLQFGWLGDIREGDKTATRSY